MIFTIPVSVEILLTGSNQCNFVDKQIFNAVHIFIKKIPLDSINSTCIILISICIEIERIKSQWTVLLIYFIYHYTDFN